MNLPPDKARLLRQYDNEKKWDLICDQVGMGGVGGGSVLCHHPMAVSPPRPHTPIPPQERFQVKSPPHAYIQKLQSFLDPGVTRKVGGGLGG